MAQSWKGFKSGNWEKEVDVADFIKQNYSEYTGDGTFLEGAVESSLSLNESFKDLLKLEKEKRWRNWFRYKSRIYNH